MNYEVSHLRLNIFQFIWSASNQKRESARVSLFLITKPDNFFEVILNTRCTFRGKDFTFLIV
jgi:hypothetical protein